MSEILGVTSSEPHLSTSFYQNSIAKSMGKIQHYLTPLERKAIRDLRKIKLKNRILEKEDDDTPMKENKGVKRSQNGNIKKPNNTNRKLHLKKQPLKTTFSNVAKSVCDISKNKTSTPSKVLPKYSWKPNSLNKKFFKYHWSSQAKSIYQKTKINQVTENLNKSLPVQSTRKDEIKEKGGILSQSFSISSQISGNETIDDHDQPAKIRKMDFDCEDGTILTAKLLQPSVEDDKNVSKFFPIFNNIGNTKSSNKTDKNTASETPISPSNLIVNVPGSQKTKSATKKDTPQKKQMIIDAGQKRFGATQCAMCGMVYTANHPEDEQDHASYHKRFLNFVKFLGWKSERIVQSFMDGRIIKVLPTDPKYATKKINDILSIVDIDLGFKIANSGFTSSKIAYLFISDTENITGCVIVEKIRQAYRLIPEKSDNLSAEKSVLCYTDTTPIPVVCGISRIWTYAPMRRKGIATRLLDAVRFSFALGSRLNDNQIALSDPTPNGRSFATKYFRTPNILVYNYSC